MTQYHVNLCKGHPGTNGDSFYTGITHDTLEAAMKTFCFPLGSPFSFCDLQRATHIELSSDEYYCVRDNELYDKYAEVADNTELEYRQEMSTQRKE